MCARARSRVMCFSSTGCCVLREMDTSALPLTVGLDVKTGDEAANGECCSKASCGYHYCSQETEQQTVCETESSDRHSYQFLTSSSVTWVFLEILDSLSTPRSLRAPDATFRRWVTQVTGSRVTSVNRKPSWKFYNLKWKRLFVMLFIPVVFHRRLRKFIGNTWPIWENGVLQNFTALPGCFVCLNIFTYTSLELVGTLS